MSNLRNLIHPNPRPDLIVGGDTIPDIFWNAVSLRREQVMMRQKALGIWRDWSWGEVGTLVRELAMGFASLGLRPGDCVSILCNTRAEWVWCDLAALSAGCVSNGIYPTSAPTQVELVCTDSCTTVLVVEDEQQLDKALEIRDRLPRLSHIVLVDAKGLARFDDPMVITLDALRRRGAAHDAANVGEFDRRRRARHSDELAILIYTAGTTGTPKGVMLSHRNLVVHARAQQEILPQHPADERICCLPLSHVVERVAGLYASIHSGTRINFVENPDTVPENVREIAPTVFSGMPRLWEKFYSSVTIAVQESGRAQQMLYAWALSVGHEVAERILKGQPVTAWLRLKSRLAGLAALDNVRRFIGIHRCRYLMSNGAPIAPDLLRWYLALGIPMYEAWGQTETAGMATLMPAQAIRLGSVGRAIPGSEVRVDPATGELLVRGANVFMGYLNQPEKTARTIDTEGWLHTGDAGTIDADGYVRVDGRLHDRIVTAQGHKLTPGELENALKVSPYVTDAVIIGHQRAFVTAIVMIEQEHVEKFAQDHDVPFSSYASLTHAPQVRALIQREIDRVNRQFPQSAQIRKFILFESRLGPEDEELTPTMKLKRGFVLNKYAEQIETMYGDGSEAALDGAGRVSASDHRVRAVSMSMQTRKVGST